MRKICISLKIIAEPQFRKFLMFCGSKRSLYILKLFRLITSILEKRWSNLNHPFLITFIIFCLVSTTKGKKHRQNIQNTNCSNKTLITTFFRLINRWTSDFHFIFRFACSWHSAGKNDQISLKKQCFEYKKTATPHQTNVWIAFDLVSFHYYFHTQMCDLITILNLQNTHFIISLQFFFLLSAFPSNC